MFSRLRQYFVAIGLVAGLSACHFQTSNLGAGDEALNAQAADAYSQLVLRQDDALLAQMSERVNQAEVQAQLPMLQGMVPEGTPPEPEVVGHESYSGTDARTYTVQQNYDYRDRTVHTATRLIREGEVWKVLSFNVNVTMKAQTAPTGEPAGEPVAAEGTT
ncbi:MAG: hypothetical protein ACO1OJ_10215 [Brevundimonas sp.]